MNERDRIRLIKLEEDIQQTREQLEEELMLEEVSGRKTLLMSRVFAKKLEQLLHRKTSMEKLSRSDRDRRSSYESVMQKRRDELNIAENSVRDVQMLLAQTVSNQSIMQSETFDSDMLTYRKLLRSKQVILANKKRAYNNWADKKVSETGITRQAMQRVNEPLQMKPVSNEPIINPMAEMPDWMKKAHNSTSIEMLTRPENYISNTTEVYSGTGQLVEDEQEELIEENPFLLNEQHKKIEI